MKSSRCDHLTVSAIDNAIAVLLAQVDALKIARTILVGGSSPSSAPAIPASPSQASLSARLTPTTRRKRGRSQATLEFHEKLKKLLREGVLTAKDLATRLARPSQHVYQALSEEGLSLRELRKQWQDGRGIAERRPDPLPTGPAGVVSGKVGR
jgi:hypothetical protein